MRGKKRNVDGQVDCQHMFSAQGGALLPTPTNGCGYAPAVSQVLSISAAVGAGRLGGCDADTPTAQLHSVGQRPSFPGNRVVARASV